MKEITGREVSRDWGGKVYEDRMKGLDAALATPAGRWPRGERQPIRGSNFHGAVVACGLPRGMAAASVILDTTSSSGPVTMRTLLTSSAGRSPPPSR